MAHKKAAGSAKNLRDSNSKYRGVKLFGGQTAQAGNIIIRQKGDKYQLGKNVYKGKDFTIHAAIDGIVTFRKKNIVKYNGRVYLKTVVEVLPADQIVKKSVAKPAVAAKKALSETTAAKTASPKKAAATKKTTTAKTTTTKKEAVKKPVAKKAPAKKTPPKAKKAE